MTLLYLGLALLGVGVALAWMNGLPGGALAAALLPPLCALLLGWGRRAHRGGASVFCPISEIGGSYLSAFDP